jgi:hypothetical protein
MDGDQVDEDHRRWTTTVVGDTEMATMTGLTSGTAYTFVIARNRDQRTRHQPASDPSNSVIVS